MNPSLKLLLVLIVAIEISFFPNIPLNILIIVLSLIYLIISKIKLKKIILFTVVAIIPAIGIFTSQLYFGKNGLHTGLILATRIYAYIYLSLAFASTTNSIKLARSLEQNCHLPSKFIYSFLAAMNLMNRFKQEIKIIKINANMRGINLSAWNPTLYFKAILVALRWSDDLASAMASQGFVENQPRSAYQVITINKKSWLIFGLLLIILQIFIFIF